MNGANRISKVRKGETGSSYYMKDAAYNAAGALASATLGLDGANQWTETRGYNSRLQARGVEVAKGANTLLRLRWAYSGSYNSTTLEETGTDNNGDLRVERLEFPHQGALQTVDRAYAYTGSDRLVSFTEPSKSQSFTYDAFGNVWQYGGVGVPSLRQTGASWYLQGGVVNNRLANTIYDAAGNQTQLSASPGTVASYDGENRMSQIKIGGAEAASYTYDAEGRRVAKTAGGVTTYYFYDAAGQLMAEYGGPAQTAATQYFTTDYLGSTRMILNGTGGCLERLDYAPFGGQIARSGMDCYGGPSNDKPLFTGQMRDGESTAGTDTGQDYFNARYLWANIARFTSPDAPFADQRPVDGQSWNMYAYVRNNPLIYMDPSGTICVSPGGGNSDYDDSSMPGPSCAEIREQDKRWRGRYGATAETDLAKAMQAEHNRIQMEARLRAQREAEKRSKDAELSRDRALTLRNAGASGAIFPCEVTISAGVATCRGGRGLSFGTNSGARLGVSTPQVSVFRGGGWRVGLQTRGSVALDGGAPSASVNVVTVRDLGFGAAGGSMGVSTGGKFSAGARGELGNVSRNGMAFVGESRLDWPLSSPCAESR